MATVEATQSASELRVVLGRLVRRLRAENTFPATQVAVLARLERDGPQTTSALAAAERVRPQSMAQTVAELRASGFVRRRPHPIDGRSRPDRARGARPRHAPRGPAGTRELAGRGDGEPRARGAEGTRPRRPDPPATGTELGSGLGRRCDRADPPERARDRSLGVGKRSGLRRRVVGDREPLGSANSRFSHHRREVLTCQTQGPQRELRRLHCLFSEGSIRATGR